MVPMQVALTVVLLKLFVTKAALKTESCLRNVLGCECIHVNSLSIYTHTHSYILEIFVHLYNYYQVGGVYAVVPNCHLYSTSSQSDSSPSQSAPSSSFVMLSTSMTIARLTLMHTIAICHCHCGGCGWWWWWRQWWYSTFLHTLCCSCCSYSI